VLGGEVLGRKVLGEEVLGRRWCGSDGGRGISLVFMLVEARGEIVSYE
jgi:hypothetical protein